MGIMTAIELKNTTWDFTCKVCTLIQNVMIGAFISMIAFGETAGRARAAAELSRHGMHDEAKVLMTQRDYK